MRARAHILSALTYTSIIVLTAQVAHAQGCCSASGAGSVTGVTSQGVIGARQLNVGLFFERFDLNDLINSDGLPVLVDGEEEAHSTTLNLSIAYGWSSQLTTSAIVSYYSRGRDFALPGLGGGGGGVSAEGIGDLTLFAKYAVLPYQPARPHELALGAGVKIPLGDDSIERRGVMLPVDVQPGSGSTDLLVWGRVFRQLTFADIAADVMWTLSGASDDGYDFGNSVQYNGTLTRPVLHNFELGVHVNGRWAPALTRNGLNVINTGGHRVHVGPTLAWQPLGRQTTIHAAFLIPIREDVNGIQQGLTRGWRIGSDVTLAGF